MILRIFAATIAIAPVLIVLSATGFFPLLDIVFGACEPGGQCALQGIAEINFLFSLANVWAGLAAFTGTLYLMRRRRKLSIPWWPLVFAANILALPYLAGLVALILLDIVA